MLQLRGRCSAVLPAVRNGAAVHLSNIYCQSIHQLRQAARGREGVARHHRARPTAVPTERPRTACLRCPTVPPHASWEIAAASTRRKRQQSPDVWRQRQQRPIVVQVTAKKKCTANDSRDHLHGKRQCRAVPQRTKHAINLVITTPSSRQVSCHTYRAPSRVAP